jgi:magnesium-transporting ATPase (P-type)
LALAILGISIIGLAAAWRWERIGGWISTAALIIFVVVFLLTVERSYPMVFLFVLGIGVPAGLFLTAAHNE